MRQVAMGTCGHGVPLAARWMCIPKYDAGTAPRPRSTICADCVKPSVVAHSATKISAAVLVCIGVAEDEEDSLHDDAKVHPERPVAEVVEVVLDASTHVVDGLGLAAVAVDLGPAGDARL